MKMIEEFGLRLRLCACVCEFLFVS